MMSTSMITLYERGPGLQQFADRLDVVDDRDGASRPVDELDRRVDPEHVAEGCVELLRRHGPFDDRLRLVVGLADNPAALEAAAAHDEGEAVVPVVAAGGKAL